MGRAVPVRQSVGAPGAVLSFVGVCDLALCFAGARFFLERSA